MKSAPRLFTPAAVLAAVLCAAVPPSGFAQANVPPSAVTKANPAQRAQELATYRAGVENAKALAKANDVAAAERALSALNKSKPKTAEWHIETAQRLLQTAEQVTREARPLPSRALVTRALQHLAQAEPLANNARTRSSAKSLAGFIHERYLADPTAALAAYQAAVQLSPNSRTAKEAVSRLQKTDANRRARISGGAR